MFSQYAFRMIDRGDHRGFSSLAGESFRVEQTFTIIPYADLSGNGLKAPFVTLPGLTTRYKKADSVPRPNDGYGPGNLLLPNPTIVESAIGRIEKHDVKLIGRKNGHPNTALVEGSSTGAEGVLANALPPAIIPKIVTKFAIAIDCIDPITPQYDVDYLFSIYSLYPAFELYIRDSISPFKTVYQYLTNDLDDPLVKLPQSDRMRVNQWTPQLQGTIP